MLFTFLAQLHAKEECDQQVAIEACKNLAKQCSDPGAVEAVVKHMFDVLNGMLNEWLSIIHTQLKLISCN